jgi:hypothetical protein
MTSDNKIIMTVLLLILLAGFSLAQITNDKFKIAEKFYAVGPDQPVVDYLDKPGWPVPRELKKVAVEVHFDLVPTKMRFSLPCYPSMVTENNIHFSNGWTETYDPKASSSCEILWDRDVRYARMWIESQNAARIILIFQVDHPMARVTGQMNGIIFTRTGCIPGMFASIQAWPAKA